METKEPVLVSDSSLFRVLSYIESKGLVSTEGLRSALENDFSDKTALDWTTEHCLNSMLLEKVGVNSLRITKSAREWLQKNSDEFLTAETEDTSSITPIKPYEVTKLKMEPKTVSIFQALRKIDKDEIDLDPEFQRAFVWDPIRQSRLIESVLLRIPLPAFYLDATNQTRWSVVDGLQRLTTLHRYCNKKAFKLEGLQFLTQLNGLSFNELPPSFQVLLEDDTSLQFYNLMPGTPVEAKFTIFSRVNTGGLQLTAQEIRHALTQGKVTKWLAKIARGHSFVNATGGALDHRRMEDRELAIRALSFQAFGVQVYREFAELDGFLLYAMGEFNSFPDAKLQEIGDLFESSLNKVHRIFGRYAFRKFYERQGRRSPLNKALFEVWVNCVSEYDDSVLISKREKIIDGFLRLTNSDETFLRSISTSTGSPSAVETRFQKIKELVASI
jgi:Protein of unknown function DUF262